MRRVLIGAAAASVVLFLLATRRVWWPVRLEVAFDDPYAKPWGDL